MATITLAPGLGEVRGLAEFVDARTRTLQMPQRLMLNALGLGIGETFAFFRSQPDLAAFEAWALAAAGPPDPAEVARYHAWLDGAPNPAAIQARVDAIDALPPVLDDADLAHWDAHGYVVIRGAITPAEAAAAADLFWRTSGASLDDPATWYGVESSGLWVPIFHGAELEAARRSPRVLKAYAQLWGTADLWLIVDQMSFNPPVTSGRPFQGAPLHWDVSLARPIPFATQGILYLTDTAADQGALRVIPGFHHRIDAWLDAMGDADPRQVDLTAEAVTIPAGAGDLVIWRQDLPHGASPNSAQLPRITQYVNMHPADLWSNPEWR